ncbi:hypothetical protein GCM10007857_83710 [Bradyrhizobium iriomotense]|uniref:Transposase n=1 Tax=Bradyrhizobium iriomotense TaxID=441950 RepID=A0ABQ6BCZ7_9BRAD|nr:hypothetical protein GCM10007857_83710 [Bradyrhizobium iriomotense]
MRPFSMRPDMLQRRAKADLGSLRIAMLNRLIVALRFLAIGGQSA